MKSYFSKKHISKLFIVMAAVTTMTLVSCKEEIDDSNLYTFTGETIEDYLANRDEFSHFNYILTRIGYDKILSAYGTYTCFAPSNEAVIAYIDSLYDDPNNKELPHNGMTARGLEGLTDSLCKDIALFHLLPSEVMTVNMKLNDGSMSYETMLGRDITVGIDSVGIKVQKSHITLMDNELENGVLHEIDYVLTRSNNLISMELAKYEELSLFTEALAATSLLDSLNKLERKGVIMPTSSTKGLNIYTPKTCKLGFTIFADTDETLRANGINNFDDLAAYAAKVYGNCAKKEGGWYDYYRNKGIEVSTGTDYSNPHNTLNMFMRYHILEYIVPYSKFFYTKAQASNAPVFEYMETMLPYTLMKVSRINGVPLINRWVTNGTLTDRVAQLASDNIAQVRREGILVKNDNIQSLNGYIHPIEGMLVYDENVPHGTLNERMRFDFLSLLPEMMSNGLRAKPYTEVEALTGGQITSGFKGRGPVRVPENFCNYIKVYNGGNTELYYLPGTDTNWNNYQGDEFNCVGPYDFAFRLPPVPDGTYELRLGFSANDQRGMMQCYMGRSSSIGSMVALDIPIDMRHEPVNKKENNIPIPDAVTGWLDYKATDDKGVESDANMRSLNWMRGPLSIQPEDKVPARESNVVLRRILVKQQFEQGEYWVRFKTVLPDNNATQFHLDYIELCPENVYNNNMYLEDMF